MILPTLQTIEVEEYETIIFWSSVGVSLLVMIANNLIAMFSLNIPLAYRALTWIWKRTLSTPGKVPLLPRGSSVHRYSTW